MDNNRQLNEYDKLVMSLMNISTCQQGPSKFANDYLCALRFEEKTLRMIMKVLYDTRVPIPAIHLCLLILRRLITSFWNERSYSYGVSTQTKNDVKYQLLDLLSKRRDRKILMAITSTIVALAANDKTEVLHEVLGVAISQSMGHLGNRSVNAIGFMKLCELISDRMSEKSSKSLGSLVRPMLNVVTAPRGAIPDEYRLIASRVLRNCYRPFSSESGTEFLDTFSDLYTRNLVRQWMKQYVRSTYLANQRNFELSMNYLGFLEEFMSGFFITTLKEGEKEDLMYGLLRKLELLGLGHKVNILDKQPSKNVEFFNRSGERVGVKTYIVENLRVLLSIIEDDNFSAGFMVNGRILIRRILSSILPYLCLTHDEVQLWESKNVEIICSSLYEDDIGEIRTYVSSIFQALCKVGGNESGFVVADFILELLKKEMPWESTSDMFKVCRVEGILFGATSIVESIPDKEVAIKFVKRILQSIWNPKHTIFTQKSYMTHCIMLLYGAVFERVVVGFHHKIIAQLVSLAATKDMSIVLRYESIRSLYPLLLHKDFYFKKRFYPKIIDSIWSVMALLVKRNDSEYLDECLQDIANRAFALVTSLGCVYLKQKFNQESIGRIGAVITELLKYVSRRRNVDLSDRVLALFRVVMCSPNDAFVGFLQKVIIPQNMNMFRKRIDNRERSIHGYIVKFQLDLFTSILNCSCAGVRDVVATNLFVGVCQLYVTMSSKMLNENLIVSALRFLSISVYFSPKKVHDINISGRSVIYHVIEQIVIPNIDSEKYVDETSRLLFAVMCSYQLDLERYYHPLFKKMLYKLFVIEQNDEEDENMGTIQSFVCFFLKVFVLSRRFSNVFLQKFVGFLSNHIVSQADDSVMGDEDDIVESTEDDNGFDSTGNEFLMELWLNNMENFRGFGFVRVSQYALMGIPFVGNSRFWGGVEEPLRNIPMFVMLLFDEYQKEVLAERRTIILDSLAVMLSDGDKRLMKKNIEDDLLTSIRMLYDRMSYDDKVEVKMQLKKKKKLFLFEEKVKFRL